jgi:hypothetical protein
MRPNPSLGRTGLLFVLTRSIDFLCLVTPLCSYLYGGLYGGLYERAHIIRYFLTPGGC